MNKNKDLCRCCLIELKDQSRADLFEPNVLLNPVEMYATMIQECFGLKLSKLNENGICEACINTLRTSWNFKLQVVHAEEKLLKCSTVCCPINVRSLNLKSRLKGRDQVKSVIRAKSSFLRKCNTMSCITIKKSSKKLNKSMKTLKELSDKSNHVNDNAAKDRAQKTTSLAEINKNVKRFGKQKLSHDSSNVCKNTTYPGEENRRHIVRKKNRHNLRLMLKYSNIVPFRNKSLLGYHCAYCMESFTDPSELRFHSENYHNKERLDIAEAFDVKNLTIVLEISNLMCTICQRMLDNLDSLKSHLTSQHGKEFFQEKDYLVPFKLKKGDIHNCALCSSTFETYQLLRRHMKSHFPNYICQECNSPFVTFHSLRMHERQHVTGSFRCEVCNKTYQTEEKLKSHQRLKHLGIKNERKCPQCGVRLKNSYHRNKHLLEVHNKKTPYKCQVCSKHFLLKTVMMDHIKRCHLKERYFQCSQCKYSAFSKPSLKCHMLKHTGEKKYQCEVCSKTYVRKWTLKEHLRIHNNDRRFKCEVCLLTFVQKCSLKSHLLTNHGISVSASEIK